MERPPAVPETPMPGAVAAEPSEEVGLSRDLGLLDATMLGVGALMGGGVFVLLGIGAGVAGPALLLSFFLNGLITAPTLMVYAELGSAFSDTGGGYLWIKQAMKQPWGFLGGWMSWFSHAIACAVYALASGFFFTWILSYAGHYPAAWLDAHGLDQHQFIVAAALAFGAVFVFLNYVGVKVSVRAENSITYLVLMVVAAFLSYGLYGLHRNPELARQNFLDFMPHGAEGMFLAMGITFIAFEGYEIISQAGEEVKDPKRTIPRAIFLSLAIVWPIILLTTWIALGLFPDVPSWKALGGGDGSGLEAAPLALVRAARHVMPYGSILIATCAMLLQLVALNATIYSSSRVSFAMGRDRNLPSFFGTIHRKRRTPHWSVLFSGGIVLTMAATLPIEAVAVAADIQFLLLFLMVNTAYLKLHKHLPPERFGYRAPLYPYLPIVGIVTKFFLAVYLYKYSPVAWYVAAGILAAGFAVYWLYVRTREHEALATGPAAAYFRPATRPRRGYRVLVPLTQPESVRGLALAARDIARGRDGEVVLLYAVTLPSATPLEAGTRFAGESRPLMAAAKSAIGGDVPVASLVRIGHDLSQTIRSTAAEEGTDLILLGWRGQGNLARTAERSHVESLIDNPPCDLALVKIADTPPPTRILHVTRGGPLAAPPLAVTAAIARSREAPVTLFWPLTPDQGPIPPDAAQAELQDLLRRTVPADVPSEAAVEASDRFVAASLARARGYDLVVISDSRTPFWRRRLVGNRPDHIAALFPGSVLLVKPYRGRRHERLRGTLQGFRRLARLLRPD